MKVLWSVLEAHNVKNAQSGKAVLQHPVMLHSNGGHHKSTEAKIISFSPLLQTCCSTLSESHQISSKWDLPWDSWRLKSTLLEDTAEHTSTSYLHDLTPQHGSFKEKRKKYRRAGGPIRSRTADNDAQVETINILHEGKSGNTWSSNQETERPKENSKSNKHTYTKIYIHKLEHFEFDWCIPILLVVPNVLRVRCYVTELGTQLEENHLKEAVVNKAIITGSRCSGHIESDLCEMIQEIKLGCATFWRVHIHLCN